MPETCSGVVAPPGNEWSAESAAIVNRGCACTDDEACWDHEELEMRSEHAQVMQRAEDDDA